MDRADQTSLLARLCQSLVRLGARVELRDAVPSLTVRSARGSTVHVFVTRTGDLTWHPLDRPHPADDPRTAAEALLALLAHLDRARPAPPDDRTEEDGGRVGL